LAARYQIEAAIGSGGSGRVLRAFDRVTRELVALKILRPEYATDPVWTERFSRELRVGRQIQHRNVCRIFDIGDADGHRFLSMELATRGAIRGQLGPTALERPMDDRITDARAVVEGVAALHAAGIVHRDIKPENLLRMEDGRLVVSDFGLATDPGAGPATTIMIGTPRYMAPEVVMGDPATTRADVWALGVVLHEILFGVRPDRSVVRRGFRCFTPPPVTSPRERRLAELCGRCSDDDPQARFPTASEVLREFEAAALGRRLGPRVDRKQMVWGALALAALFTLGIVRDRWTNSAVASSSQVAGSISRHVPTPSGVAADWSAGSTKLASFPGEVHCLSVDKNNTVARVIWGKPRRAEDVRIGTGFTTPAALRPETFEVGCPQVSPDGLGLLFEKNVDGASQIFVSVQSDGRDARFLIQGSAPVWLPNGQEFVFALDDRHAATFSIPTHQITVAADDLGASTELEEKVIDEPGSRVALLYARESLETLLVVRALPGLDVIGQMSVPPWTRHLRFLADGDISLTTFGSKGTRQLASANIKTGSLVNLAEVPGSDFQRLVGDGDTQLIESRKRLMDLWRVGDAGTSRLTSDGHSASGSASPTGELAIQRLLADGREVIIFRDQKGHESQITDGPTDSTPAFLPDGKTWVYSHIDTGQLLECSVQTKHCVVVHADPMTPIFPTPDPSGKRIAYITALNNSRVRVFSREMRKEQDLGPALACPPFWTSDHHLWVVTSQSPKGRTWQELDVESVRPTGNTHFADNPISGDDCTPPRVLMSGVPDRVVGIWIDTTDLIKVPRREGR
jgi:serine/threonine-protein kinase